eukprot:tig00000405_g500.t1
MLRTIERQSQTIARLESSQTSIRHQLGALQGRSDSAETPRTAAAREAQAEMDEMRDAIADLTERVEQVEPRVLGSLVELATTGSASAACPFALAADVAELTARVYAVEKALAGPHRTGGGGGGGGTPSSSKRAFEPSEAPASPPATPQAAPAPEAAEAELEARTRLAAELESVRRACESLAARQARADEQCAAAARAAAEASAVAASAAAMAHAARDAVPAAAPPVTVTSSGATTRPIRQPLSPLALGPLESTAEEAPAPAPGAGAGAGAPEDLAASVEQLQHQLARLDRRVGFGLADAGSRLVELEKWVGVAGAGSLLNTPRLPGASSNSKEAAGGPGGADVAASAVAAALAGVGRGGQGAGPAGAAPDEAREAREAQRDAELVETIQALNELEARVSEAESRISFAEQSVRARFAFMDHALDDAATRVAATMAAVEELRQQGERTEAALTARVDEGRAAAADWAKRLREALTALRAEAAARSDALGKAVEGAAARAAGSSPSPSEVGPRAPSPPPAPPVRARGPAAEALCRGVEAEMRAGLEAARAESRAAAEAALEGPPRPPLPPRPAPVLKRGAVRGALEAEAAAIRGEVGAQWSVVKLHANEIELRAHAAALDARAAEARPPRPFPSAPSHVGRGAGGGALAALSPLRDAVVACMEKEARAREEALDALRAALARLAEGQAAIRVEMAEAADAAARARADAASPAGGGEARAREAAVNGLRAAILEQAPPPPLPPPCRPLLLSAPLQVEAEAEARAAGGERLAAEARRLVEEEAGARRAALDAIQGDLLRLGAALAALPPPTATPPSSAPSSPQRGAPHHHEARKPEDTRARLKACEALLKAHSSELETHEYLIRAQAAQVEHCATTKALENLRTATAEQMAGVNARAQAAEERVRQLASAVVADQEGMRRSFAESLDALRFDVEGAVGRRGGPPAEPGPAPGSRSPPPGQGFAARAAAPEREGGGALYTCGPLAATLAGLLSPERQAAPPPASANASPRRGASAPAPPSLPRAPSPFHPPRRPRPRPWTRLRQPVLRPRRPSPVPDLLPSSPPRPPPPGAGGGPGGVPSSAAAAAALSPFAERHTTALAALHAAVETLDAYVRYAPHEQAARAPSGPVSSVATALCSSLQAVVTEGVRAGVLLRPTQHPWEFLEALVIREPGSAMAEAVGYINRTAPPPQSAEDEAALSDAKFAAFVRAALNKRALREWLGALAAYMVDRAHKRGADGGATPRAGFVQELLEAVGPLAALDFAYPVEAAAGAPAPAPGPAP